MDNLEKLAYQWAEEKLQRNAENPGIITDEALAAAEEPEHPATLETVEDYENAPAGTIVAEPGCPAWTKGYGQTYSWSQGGTWLTNSDMANTARQVLRKGWGR